MTALVSLLFITMIPIDCKITNFSLHLFVYFFGNNYNIGEPTSATLKERMTMNIIFTSAAPINIMKSSYASKLCICVCSPRCTAL